ncbi:hypothetical protein BJY01DRAFT_256290 [Aspergillus pseudoustus]|uniref:Uncharacterized protein n=1 Tax=Aspergillus pseudoustus TaxID=1810923 RepID=A0ABR4IC20_9EURO
MSDTDFLRLPREIRNNIYRRILAVPHPIYLSQDPDVQSREASAVPYAANRFTLEEVVVVVQPRRQLYYYHGLLESFLDCIGRANAASLSHLSITFPAIDRLDVGICLTEDGSRILDRLRQECTGLMTIETLVNGQESSCEVFGEEMEGDDSVRNMFLEMDAKLKGIESLRTITVKVSSSAVSTSVRESLQELGWVV